jgi:hypothetical protein
MMSILKAGLGFVGIGGAGVSSGWLILGAVAAVLAVLGGTWKSGYDYRATLDEAAALRIENARLQAAADEADLQRNIANRIQQSDADRAKLLADRNKELERNATNVQIQCDPPVPLPSAVHDKPAPKGIRSTSPKYPGSTIRRGTLRGRPNIAPGQADGGRSEPPVEPRPGFAR